jgi:hypothetical protein
MVGARITFLFLFLVLQDNCMRKGAIVQRHLLKGEVEQSRNFERNRSPPPMLRKIA